MSDDASAAISAVDTSAVDSVIVNSTAPVEETTRDISVTVVETTTTVVTETVKPANPFFSFLVSLAFCKCAAPSQTSEVKDRSLPVEDAAATPASPAPVAAAAASTETESTSTIVVAEATAAFEEFVEVTTTTVTTTETIVEEVDAPASVLDTPASPISEVASSTLTDETAAVKKSEDNNTGSEAGSTSGTTKEKKARRRMSQTIKDFGGKLRTLGRSKTSASLDASVEEEKEA